MGGFAVALFKAGNEIVRTSFRLGPISRNFDQSLGPSSPRKVTFTWIKQQMLGPQEIGVSDAA